MDHSASSPPHSLPSTPSNRVSRTSSSSRSRPTLSLDLSNLPPLTNPTPATNTLLITDLHDLTLFQPPNLTHLREAIITPIAPLNSFSPLPSFRRIVCSFNCENDATRVRKHLDGQALLEGRDQTIPKIYFGEPTPLLDEGEDSFRPKLLQAPQQDKLFFISPPPSPPHGWVMRTEDPPNKEVHASDLAHALADLKTEQQQEVNAMEKIDPDTPVSMSSDNRTASWPVTSVSGQRSRSSTLIYHPEDHGTTPNLPAVLVEDTSAAGCVDSDVEMSPIEIQPSRPGKKLPPKTAMPPIELMES